MSTELPAAAADPDVVAGVWVVQNGEHGLFRAMVMSAETLAVGSAGRAAWPRHAMVLVRPHRRPAAAGEHAGAVAGFEEALQPRWEPVAGARQLLHHRGCSEPRADRIGEHRPLQASVTVEDGPLAAG